MSTQQNDNWRLEQSDGCTKINCHNKATFTLDLRVYMGVDRDRSYEDHIPYCDNDIGWFYRSFSRKSYDNTEVLGITILEDADGYPSPE